MATRSELLIISSILLFSINLFASSTSPFDPFRLEENRFHKFEFQDRDLISGEGFTISSVAEKPYDVIHYGLDVTFPEAEKYFEGRASISLELVDKTDSISFDFEGMVVDGVLMNGNHLSWVRNKGLLTIKLPGPFQAKSLLTLEINYHGSPSNGLYLSQGSNNEYPTIFTLVEPEHARHWFPCYDAPHDKALSSVTITVPKPLVAISNGLLRRVYEDEASKSTTYYWEENYPIATYLISIAVADYVKLESEWNNLPIQFFVHPGDEKKAQSTLGRTSSMMEFFSTYITPYPFMREKYAVVMVPGESGAMEHTTATTFGRGLLGESLYYGESVAVHELAHHWWGDDVTVRDWNHLWLNEGFAMYFDVLWYEWLEGSEKLIQRMEGYRRSAIFEDNILHTPIVDPENLDFNSLFNSIIYDKGAWVLHMLRKEIGDDLFWKGIREYEKRFRYSGVITEDFKQVIEEISNRDLSEFFSQWIYGPGHPVFDVSYKYDDAKHSLYFNINQTQGDDLFKVKLPVTIYFRDSSSLSLLLTSINREDKFVISNVLTRPSNVRFDPQNSILKEMSVKKMEEEWIEQAKGSDWYGKLEAIRALGEQGSEEGFNVILNTVQNTNEHYLIRDAGLESLGKRKDKRVLEILMKYTREYNRWLRIGAVAGLGHCGFVEAILPLVDVLKGDSSEWVRASAAFALKAYREDSLTREALQFALINDKSERVRAIAKQVLDEDLVMKWPNYWNK